MEGEQKYKVQVNLYDLSGGMAKVFSPTFLGKQIEGIWHTGVTVYNKEFYFGGGICSSAIKQTPYGTPVKEITIGETEIPEEVFSDYLSEISNKYSMEKYDLFSNNCNNFTEDCVHFLCDSHLPEYITGLPAEVLKTPIGQMIKPIIDNMQNQVIQQSGGASLFPQQFEGANNNQQMFGGQNQNQQQSNNIFPQQGQGLGQFQSSGTKQFAKENVEWKNVAELTDFMQFIDATSNNKAIVIYFYSDECRPCALISPIYAQMSEQFKDIKFFLVDGEKLREISAQFQIQGFPTFFTYFNGEMISQWMGANQTKLQEKLKELQQKLQ
ncbi:Thioredoxin-like fold [Pseudocohnilembus persalinus]|uniref:Thioredoxin-like fold n=1 Tax=Pseudocohnilembus persalinus TaxID=266149 RepID=A0A0V0QBN0_PSEPJ|nr:Thioredoxin-like fold [Pseudocohnilembus persalinus]|eukprot:KRW99460.1 Thioredoxin-like fold [Pseudocohnilembus persalinus]